MISAGINNSLIYIKVKPEHENDCSHKDGCYLQQIIIF